MTGSVQISFVLITMIFSSMIMYHSAPTEDADNRVLFDLPPANVKSAEATKISGSVFTRNNGQIKDEGILFYGNGPDGRIAFSKDGIYFTSVKRSPEIEEHPFPDPKQLVIEDRIPSTEGARVSINTIKLSFPGRNDVIPTGRDPAPWFSNFFYGNDPGKWRTQVPNYREIVYEDLWNGIDLVYRTDSGSVKYDIIIHPGSDPSRIGFRVEGHNSLVVNERGDLVIATDHRDLLDTGLVAFYEDGPNERTPCDFMITGHDTYGFEIGSYDLSRVLIVDPLIYSTFIGGENGDFNSYIAVDFSGNAFITGTTGLYYFPTTVGAFDTEYNGVQDVFITKLDNSGSSLIYSTFIGGSGGDFGYGIALDSSGNAYITGYTNSTDYPTTMGAYNTTYNGGWCDVFVTKLDSTGSSIVYSTFIGGSGNDYGHGIAVDHSGNAYITGYTNSINYPTTKGVYNMNHHGVAVDVFVTKLDSTGSSLLYSTFIGGVNNEAVYGIAVDHSGNTYITGHTESTDYPTTVGAYDTTYNGGWCDVFVTKLDSAGSSLVYSTFIGGGEFDYAYGIVTDPEGSACIIGYTNSINYPTSKGAYDKTHNGGYDVFLTKLDSAGSSLIYSTYIGGSGNDYGHGIALDHSGNAYITGYTASTDYPITWGSYDTTINGRTDVFVSKLDSAGSSLVYSTYLGGSGSERGYGIVLDSNGNAFITGDTASEDYPTTIGAYDTQYHGGYDVFVTKLDFIILPEIPLNLSAVVGDTFVNLSWDPPEFDGGAPIIDYEIHRGIKSGILTSLANTGGNLTFNDTSVVNGNRYYYAILAYNHVGPGEFSNELSAVPATIPSSPRNVVAVYGNMVVNLTWISPEYDGGSLLMGYRLYKFKDGSSDPTVLIIQPYILTYSDNDVENGANYRYYMTAFNAMGESLPSLEVNAAPKTRPSMVLNVRAEAGADHVILYWSAPERDGGSPVTNYLILRAVGYSGFGNYRTLSSKTFEFNDTDLEIGIIYRYKVIAINSEGASNPTDEVSAIPMDRPTQPKEMKVEAYSRLVRLTWSYPDHDGGAPILGYYIYRSEEEGDWEQISSPDFNENTYTDNTVFNGRTYWYMMTAFNVVGESDPTQQVKVTPLGVPGVPVDFTVDSGDGYVMIFWDVPLNQGGTAVIDFLLYRGYSSSDMDLFRYISASERSYNDTQITNGRTYYYKVAAVNKIGNGSFTETKSARPTGIPSPPSNVQVIPGDRYAKISWSVPVNDGGDPVTEVKIYRGVDPNSSVLILTSNVLTGLFIDSAVTNGITYRYTLTSTNSIGESVHSPPISATPSGKPTAPGNVKLEVGSDHISLTWDPPSDTGGIPLTGYRIYRSSGTGDPVMIAELGPEVNDYVDRDVEGGRRYQYWVSAVNDNGEGPLSDPVEGKVKKDSGLVLVVAISVIVIFILLLLGIASAVIILRRRESPPHPDASSPPIPSAIQDSTPGEGEIPPSQGSH